MSIKQNSHRLIEGKWCLHASAFSFENLRWVWWVPKKPIFNFVQRIACVILIQSLWNLQINRTDIKYSTSWKLDHIALFTLELHALDCWKVRSQVSDRWPLGCLFCRISDEIRDARLTSYYYCNGWKTSNHLLQLAPNVINPVLWAWWPGIEWLLKLRLGMNHKNRGEYVVVLGI